MAQSLMKKTISIFQSQKNIGIFIAVFVLVGLSSLLLISAAPINDIEVENSPLVGDIEPFDDPTASGGRAVRFANNIVPDPGPDPDPGPNPDPGPSTYSPPSLPGPTCAKINGSNVGPWEAIDPSCVSIRDRSQPSARFGNFGGQAIDVAESSPNVVILGTYFQGLWRTTDRGENWTRLSINNADPTPCDVLNGGNWGVTINPENPDIIYAASGYSASGCDGQGLWRTTDGGATWRQAIPESIMSQTSRDPYTIHFDPYDSNHIVVTSHGYWPGRAAGLLHSRDGGQTWSIIEAQDFGWAASPIFHFLDNGNTWIVATENSGLWRTTDGGASWSRASGNFNAFHGAGGAYSTSSRVHYLGVNGHVLRSSDNGASWTSVYQSPCGFTVTGDGTNLYASPSTPNGCDGRFLQASESNDTNWEVLGSGLSNGAFSMAVDPVSRTVYSSNWNAGIFRYSY